MNKLQKLGILGVLMGATSFTGSKVIPRVSGNEDYINARVETQVPYAQRHGYNWSRKDIVNQADNDRETGREVATNLGYSLGGVGLLALLAGLYKRKTE